MMDCLYNEDMKNNKYLIPMRSSLIVQASAVEYNDEQSRVYVDFFLGESKYSLSVDVENRECYETFEVDAGNDLAELYTADVLNHIVDCDLLADDVISELASGRLEQYNV